MGETIVTPVKIAAALCVAVLSTAAAEPTPPKAPQMDFIFEAEVLLSPRVEVGQTGFGNRDYIPIIGGHFAGTAIKGTVVSGGWDWQLQTAAGCSSLHADYFLQTDNGTVVNVVNHGQFCQVAGKPTAPPVQDTALRGADGAL